jgi:hypothetical protein
MFSFVFLFANKVSSTVCNVSNFVFTPLLQKCVFSHFYARIDGKKVVAICSGIQAIISVSAAGIFIFDKEH